MPTKELFDQGSTYRVSGNYDLSAPTIQIVKAPVSGFPLWVEAGFPPVRWDKIEIISEVKPNIYYDEFKEKRPEVARQIETLKKEDTEQVNIFDIKPLVSTVSKASSGVMQSIGGGVNKVVVAGLIVLGILIFRK
jgi:hypothetical protein